MNRRLKSLVSLVIDQADRGELPYVALEHLESGTGALMPGVELPIRRGGEPGVGAVRQGDVLFGKLRPYLAKTLLVREPAYASTELMALRPNSGVDSRWLAYLVGSGPLIEWATASSDGVKMPRTSWEQLGEFRVVDIPELAAQRSIADYLDTETTRIDALIEKKEKLSALLVEHEHSRIRNLVSCGTEMSPVSVTYPPADGTPTPPGWRSAPLRSICTFETGKAHENFVSENGTYVCVNSRFVSTEGRISKRCEQNLSPARKNDILMVMSDLPNGRALAKAFFVESDGQFAVNQRVCIIGPRNIEPKYAFYQLDRNPYFLAFDDGSNQTHLSSSCFTSFKMLVPPREEQLRIVKTLDAATATRRKITQAISSQIEKLSEFRQALITTAVTGELDVAGVAA